MAKLQMLLRITCSWYVYMVDSKTCMVLQNQIVKCYNRLHSDLLIRQHFRILVYNSMGGSFIIL